MTRPMRFAVSPGYPNIQRQRGAERSNCVGIEQPTGNATDACSRLTRCLTRGERRRQRAGRLNQRGPGAGILVPATVRPGTQAASARARIWRQSRAPSYRRRARRPVPSAVPSWPPSRPLAGSRSRTYLGLGRGPIPRASQSRLPGTSRCILWASTNAATLPAGDLPITRVVVLTACSRRRPPLLSAISRTLVSESSGLPLSSPRLLGSTRRRVLVQRSTKPYGDFYLEAGANLGPEGTAL
jgi:hypothetical protein